MNIHKNARLTPIGRERLVEAMLGGQTPEAAARAAGVCPKTARKWMNRFKAEGRAGLTDRSSRPRHLYRATPEEVVRQIERLRRQRRTGQQIAVEVRVSPATVSRVLKRLGLNRIAALEPAEPIRRYEREKPGDLIHIDIKKLGRFNQVGHRITGDRTRQSSRRGIRQGEAWGAGWEFVHVAIDDNSRIAFAKVMPNEKKRSATAFLRAAVAYYASLGVRIQRVMSDNGACYKSCAFRRACKQLGLRHIRTRPYTPRTNGKAERFIQTTLREWAYARAYQSSNQRRSFLPDWLHSYNWHRPHAGIDDKVPISRLGLSGDNLLSLHT
jgi:transposase InsO family protein